MHDSRNTNSNSNNNNDDGEENAIKNKESNLL